MNKYRNTSIILTSICSIGLASISLAQESNQLKFKQQNLEEITALDISNLFVDDNQSSVTGINAQGKLLHDKQHSIGKIKLENASATENPDDSSRDEVVTLVEPKPGELLPQALDIIREFEGFREQAYVDTDGTPVIGYGLSKVDGRKVRLGDRISNAKANTVLSKEVLILQEQISSMVTVELNSNQLSALSSFAFNVGIYGFQSSTLLKKLNAGDYEGAANEFVRWNKAHIRGKKVPLAGLTRRREAEKQLFLK
ncbi:phage-related lysozyme (muraminidase) [Xenococcus sp. PCC 7305]|uniref:lysozyme n=1 Tax=Xenococcus sp. PCC 7305 TaxID=102125 RepID=UPI0002AC6128|nr:lysozyme [Xenococcus sp. PCC 7305]ELS04063.1 phage-related lysozyme (muraminidase) [Xenococcus sp. PCC 7305]